MTMMKKSSIMFVQCRLIRMLLLKTILPHSEASFHSRTMGRIRVLFLLLADELIKVGNALAFIFGSD